MINQLDTAILSALEIDTDYNVNVMTGSDGVIRMERQAGTLIRVWACKMSLVISPLVRGRISTIVDKVNTVVTPGTSIDVIVTEVGIAINPDRQDLIEHFKTLDVASVYDRRVQKRKLTRFVGTPESHSLWR